MGSVVVLAVSALYRGAGVGRAVGSATGRGGGSRTEGGRGTRKFSHLSTRTLSSSKHLPPTPLLAIRNNVSQEEAIAKAFAKEQARAEAAARGEVPSLFGPPIRPSVWTRVWDPVVHRVSASSSVCAQVYVDPEAAMEGDAEEEDN